MKNFNQFVLGLGAPSETGDDDSLPLVNGGFTKRFTLLGLRTWLASFFDAKGAAAAITLSSLGAGTAATKNVGDFDAAGAAAAITLTSLGAGTAATHDATDFDAAGAAAAITKTSIGLGSVTNDAQTKASIVPNTAPAAGKILVGNAGGTAYAAVSISGDATLAADGTLTVTGVGGTTRTVSASTGSKTVTNVDGKIFLDGSEGPFTMTYNKVLTNVVEFWLDGVGITPVTIQDTATSVNSFTLLNAGQAWARVVGDGTKMHAGYVQ